MTFAWPWLLMFLLIPLAALKVNVQPKRSSEAIAHPYLASLGEVSSQTQQHPYLNWRNAAAILAWSFLVLALARPQWIGEPIAQPLVGRSIMLTVDISGSMGEREMVWNGQRIARYQAVQSVVGNFAANRKGDFLGLVVFGSFADIQAPLTPDVKAVESILSDLLPGMAGESTAIGDGLALAVQRLREIDTDDKVIVLLTDGENKAGSVSPQDAANIAKQSNIRVHTIGFGRQGSAFFGDPVDTRTLTAIAQTTQGQFFRATNSAELKAIFETIDALEPSESEGIEQRTIMELYYWPLLFSVILILILSLTTLNIRRTHQNDLR